MIPEWEVCFERRQQEKMVEKFVGCLFCFTFTVERQVNAPLYVHNKSDHKKISNNKERCQHKVLNLGRLIFAQITISLH